MLGPFDRAGLWGDSAVLIITVHVDLDIKVLASASTLLGRPELGPGCKGSRSTQHEKKCKDRMETLSGFLLEGVTIN